MKTVSKVEISKRQGDSTTLIATATSLEIELEELKAKLSKAIERIGEKSFLAFDEDDVGVVVVEMNDICEYFETRKI